MIKMICWRLVVASIALALSITITGCYFLPKSEDKKIDYKSAGKLPPLDIPPDLVTPETNERYIIPGQDQGSTTFSQYNREASNRSGASLDLLPESIEAGVYIKRAGIRRWLVVPQEPEVVWPIVKEFWRDLGFLIEIETPEVGVLETDWAENRAKVPKDFFRSTFSMFSENIYATTERDKFRTRLERVGSGTTEIYITHKGMGEIIDNESTEGSVWQSRPTDSELEAEMLTRLMLRFGAKKNQVQPELAATSNATEKRAFLDSDQGKSTLVVNEAFDRSWRRVGLALDRVGFTVEDRDRAEGIYFVRYVTNPENEDSIISKKVKDGILKDLMFWQSDDDDTKVTKYRIQVRETSIDSSRISVLDNTDDDMPVDPTTTNHILGLLYEQLK